MSRARVLADYVSSGDELALKAPITNAALVTPNLGTPSAGVMTNVTGMPLAGLSATGTASATTFLRGDNAWGIVDTADADTIPHIIPDVLYPAVANIMMDGTTALSAVTTGPNGSTITSSKYGTVQSDGRMYYYTDIKGSKPIKDPRIGAYFGSQRHSFKSLQLLEQESGLDGQNIYSIDGREWARSTATMMNDGQGNRVSFITGTSDLIEVTGYFMDAHLLSSVNDGTRTVKVDLDGVEKQATLAVGATINSPYFGRYVETGSIVNAGLGSTTLGIHTMKFTRVTANSYYSGIELIAQNIQDFTATNATNVLTTIGHTLSDNDAITFTGADLPNGLVAPSEGAPPTGIYYVRDVSGNDFKVAATIGGTAVTFSDDGSGSRTWTATNNIQIPNQNVVSNGKKFNIPASTPHYNPFAFKTDGVTAWTSGNHNSTAWPVGTGSSTNIDTATSLGLDAWVSTNYYYPYNGGRVVKWIDTDGTIKTSVNMMPPNARSIVNSAALTNGTEKGDDSAGTSSAAVANDTYFPTFTDQAIDHSQAEVAKRFHIREFGNGAANGGTGGTYADASMLNTVDDIAFVMEDGTTSISGDAVSTQGTTGSIVGNANADNMYVTFIGTGITVTNVTNSAGTDDILQNLPYGSHILDIAKNDAGSSATYVIDGISLGVPSIGTYGEVTELSIHQPKMPPIPEDAVVISDYMLMADFKPQTGTAGDIECQISKGVRYVSGSKDHFCDGGAAFATTVPHGGQPGLALVSGTGDNTAVLRFFGTTTTFFVTHSNQAWPVLLNGNAVTETKLDNTGTNTVFHDAMTIAESLPLGQNRVKTTLPGGQYYLTATCVVSPIHTSSHYQSFETPFLHDLVGGDRNMEQTNLVVTPDGKTWDEVTRDVSYIGNTVLQGSCDSGNFAYTAIVPLDEWRGFSADSAYRSHFNKNFVIAYDRVICLIDSEYEITLNGLLQIASSDAFYCSLTQNQHSSYSSNVIIRLQMGGTGDFSMSQSAVVQLKRGDYLTIFGGMWSNDNTHYNSLIIKKVN